MASLRDIRKRIKSVKSTRQITKAMKMVSAAKLRKAQEAVVSARPYGDTLERLIADIAARVEPGAVTHPLLAGRPEKKAEVILVTSDRGLAGGFNGNIAKRAWKFIREEGASLESVTVTTIGRKGGDFLRARSVPLRKDWPGTFAKLKWDTAVEISEEVAQRFISGEVDSVYLAYNEFVSAISQKITFQKLLPFEAATSAEKNPATQRSLIDFKYEPDPQSVFEALIPTALYTRIYRALLESVASEHGARMTAMEAATKNAGEMIGKLTLFYNRTRQATITKELMEIVSGAEALK